MSSTEHRRSSHHVPSPMPDPRYPIPPRPSPPATLSSFPTVQSLLGLVSVSDYVLFNFSLPSSLFLCFGPRAVSPPGHVRRGNKGAWQLSVWGGG